MPDHQKRRRRRARFSAFVSSVVAEALKAQLAAKGFK